jgi:hypothetical protein
MMLTAPVASTMVIRFLPRALVKAALASADLAALRWFFDAAPRPAGQPDRPPSVVLFRGVGGQAGPDAPTPAGGRGRWHQASPTFTLWRYHAGCAVALKLKVRRALAVFQAVASGRGWLAEAWAVGLGALRGGAAARGRLPGDVVPVVGREGVLGNQGSAAQLGWHSNGGFDRDGLVEGHLGRRPRGRRPAARPSPGT